LFSIYGEDCKRIRQSEHIPFGQTIRSNNWNKSSEREKETTEKYIPVTLIFLRLWEIQGVDDNEL
jgi:hypothetical protein